MTIERDKLEDYIQNKINIYTRRLEYMTNRFDVEELENKISELENILKDIPGLFEYSAE